MALLQLCNSRFLHTLKHAEIHGTKLLPWIGSKALTPMFWKFHPSSPRHQHRRQQCQYSNNHFFSGKFHEPLKVHFPITEYEQKLEELRQFLLEREDEGDTKESLMIIDAIQRLGVGNHYHKEIDAILTKHYSKTCTDKSNHRFNSTLHNVSLSFRVLRYHGYNVQADVFNDFKSVDGTFNGERIRHDIWGLMELYEAAQLSFEGEDILDEAREFSKQILHEHCLSDAADRDCCNNIWLRLKHPYHKSLTRLTQRNILESTKETQCRWKKTLREIVDMNFHMQKSLFQDELRQVSTWWNGLGITRELTRARSNPMRWYTWSIIMLNGDISLSEERVHLAKSIAFIHMIDDIFDIYGSPDDLSLLAEAIEKWDYAAIAMFPDYMKKCYKTLLDTINNTSHMICRKYGHNVINHLKQTWVSLCNALLVEAKWFASGELPRAEEYLDNANVSIGVHLLLIHLYFLLGLGGTNESEDLLNGMSSIMSCVSTILRLWDDFESIKGESQDGTDGSYLACYLKENPHLSFEQVQVHMMKMISREWKQLNKECFLSPCRRNSSKLLFQEASLNLARMLPSLDSFGDNQRVPPLEKDVVDMFFNQP